MGTGTSRAGHGHGVGPLLPLVKGVRLEVHPLLPFPGHLAPTVGAHQPPCQRKIVPILSFGNQ